MEKDVTSTRSMLLRRYPGSSMASTSTIRLGHLRWQRRGPADEHYRGGVQHSPGGAVDVGCRPSSSGTQGHQELPWSPSRGTPSSWTSATSSSGNEDPEFMQSRWRRVTLSIMTPGHAHGNLHIYGAVTTMMCRAFMKESDEFYEEGSMRAVELGGLISGEHGIGSGKILSEGLCWARST